MLVDIYVSETKSSVFIVVPAGTSIASVGIPTHADLARLRLFKSNKNVDAGENLVGMKADDVLAQIAARGFAIIGAEVRSSEL